MSIIAATGEKSTFTGSHIVSRERRQAWARPAMLPRPRIAPRSRARSDSTQCRNSAVKPLQAGISPNQPGEEKFARSAPSGAQKMLSAFIGVFGPFWRVLRLYGYFITFCTKTQIRAVSGTFWGIPGTQCRIDRKQTVFCASGREESSGGMRIPVDGSSRSIDGVLRFLAFLRRSAPQFASPAFFADLETQSPVDGPVLHVLTGKNPRQ